MHRKTNNRRGIVVGVAAASLWAWELSACRNLGATYRCRVVWVVAYEIRTWRKSATLAQLDSDATRMASLAVWGAWRISV